MSTARANRRGVTLLELVVALVVVGVTTGAALLAARTAVDDAARSRASLYAAILEARRVAIATGAPRTLRVRLTDLGEVVPDGSEDLAGTVRYVTVLPDGGVIADSSLGVARLTGRSTTTTEGTR